MGKKKMKTNNFLQLFPETHFTDFLYAMKLKSQREMLSAGTL